MSTPDPTMEAIAAAVTDGHAGRIDEAREALLRIWDTIGAGGDGFHRCTLAHYLADLYEDDPAQALAWDVRALDAANTLTDSRVQAHHADLRIAGFAPSLHLNLADNYRRLGSFGAAGEHIAAAREACSALSGDEYGDMIRGAVEGVAAAISAEDVSKRVPA